MEWLNEKILNVESALKEIESSTLTNETKMTVLKCLKDELNLLNNQKKKITNDFEIVNGLRK